MSAWSADYNKQVLTNADFTNQDFTDALLSPTTKRELCEIASSTNLQLQAGQEQ